MNTADSSSRTSSDGKQPATGQQQVGCELPTWPTVEQQVFLAADARAVVADSGRRPSGNGQPAAQSPFATQAAFPSVFFSPAHLAAGAAAYGNLSSLQQQQLLQQCLPSSTVASPYAAMLVNLPVDRAQQLVSQMSRIESVDKSSSSQPRLDALGTQVKAVSSAEARAGSRGNIHGIETMESNRLLADSALVLDNSRKRLSSDRPLSLEGQGQVEDGYLSAPLAGKVKRRLMSDEQARVSGHYRSTNDNDVSVRLVSSLPAADLQQLGLSDKMRMLGKHNSLGGSSRAEGEDVKVRGMNSSPSQGAQPHYPAHFYSGSLIQLATGAVKKVEDLCTEDFVISASASRDLKIDSCVVVRMEPVPQRDTVMLGFCIGQQRFQVTVEATLEHPFFVYSRGWASCSPQRTYEHYGLRCEQLAVGDVCVSLTNRLPLPSSVSASSLPLPSAQRPFTHGNGVNPPQSSARREVSLSSGRQYDVVHQSTTHSSPTQLTQRFARRSSKDTVSQSVVSNGLPPQLDHSQPIAAAPIGHWVEQRTRKRSFSAPDLHENNGENGGQS